ncbi:hypothetical protein AG1IA_03882 [Rhizoctonia solani AG-1 IA]|uniref:Uncharacterized protein n=1 Tax=Thanatephorus cucumeris (strain AG1-IA) TaxID=983506 RepID=L8X0E1_THACA|nr:hypothetical protein AG1IA_03882 [Rhizoctonia solani AG-1 IA]
MHRRTHIDRPGRSAQRTRQTCRTTLAHQVGPRVRHPRWLCLVRPACTRTKSARHILRCCCCRTLARKPIQSEPVVPDCLSHIIPRLCLYDPPRFRLWFHPLVIPSLKNLPRRELGPTTCAINDGTRYVAPDIRMATLDALELWKSLSVLRGSGRLYPCSHCL